MADIDLPIGSARDVIRQVRDFQGAAFTSVTTPFAGTETLTAYVWPGDALANLFSPTATWSDATTGKYQLTFTSANTSSLTRGIYYFRTVATSGGRTGEIDRGTLRLLPTQSTGTQALAFVTLEDVLDVAPWIEELQASSDQAGLTEARVNATNELIDMLSEAWRSVINVQTLALADRVTFGTGYWQTGTSRWFRDQIIPLTPDQTVPSTLANRTAAVACFADSTIATALQLNPEVKRMVAYLAASKVCQRQIGRESDRDYGALGRDYYQEAMRRYRSISFVIDLANPQTGNGWTLFGGSSSRL